MFKGDVQSYQMCKVTSFRLLACT